MPEYGVETDKRKELHQIMLSIDSWGIDIFRVDDLAAHRPLTAIAYTILKVHSVDIGQCF